MEDCNYFTQEAVQQADSSARREETEQPRTDGVTALLSNLKSLKNTTHKPHLSSLAEGMGYSEDSHTNTLALLRKTCYEAPFDGKDQDLPNEIVAEAQQTIGQMPDRPILDFLIRYFVAEVNWIDQLMYIPWFLEQYQLWWASTRHSTIFDLEFAVTIACDDIADQLAKICADFNPKGSLLRVQHLAFAGLKSRCEGRNATETSSEMGELEKETRRRVSCNLYIWDSLLSRQLDRDRIFLYRLDPQNMPRMRLGSDIQGTKDLNEFTERLLQIRLANFWKSARVDCNYEQDFVVAEERYEKFCNEYLATLPSAFDLHPDTQWGAQLSVSPKQRLLLHISIFESLCYNFRSALLQNPLQARTLPQYKQVLLVTLRRRLAVAALHVLKCTAALYALMGGSETCFSDIIRPTFEAAVLLINIPATPGFFEWIGDSSYSSSSIDPPEAGVAHLEQDECIRATRDALARLQMLAKVSNIAEMSAEALLQLLQRHTSWFGLEKSEARPSHPANLNSRRVFLPGTAIATDLDYSDMNWEESVSGL